MNDLAELSAERATRDTAALLRVRGVVQGVGFRPTAWRIARRLDLRGWVKNDGQGATLHVCGPAAAAPT
jgi:hydrogenase maturation protein HypF